MPEKLDRCVEDVEEKIKEGNLKKTYKDKETREVKKTNPNAICKARIKE